MAINYYDSFRRKLEEIFMMDHAELDFGIYRIMNQKRQDIQNFLQNQLLPQVKTALQSNDGDVIKARQRMQEIEAQLGADIDSLPKSIPMVAEYDQLKAQVGNAGDTDALQSEVFSHLVTFFSRYYDGGDFLSKRRYKANTYAIPYNGEEVKLHWANSDQYYIKTSEYFRDYTFVLPTSRRKVHFVLKDASTEQNNNLSANNMERRFALLQPDNGEPILEVTIDDDLNIFFTYELMPKTTKQKDLNAAALNTILPQIPVDFEELKSLSPTASNAQRTLLEKHITDYTAKNSFDYFIHKDLGSFLHRELDFYIKNEVLFIDDLDERHVSSQLAVVRAIKLVGEKIITMLAQLEDFQKRLWLKKKFVVDCDYCITLDRVPEKLYPEIASNDAQRVEWVRLFAIDEINGDALHPHGYSEPLSIDFIKENPFLVLDTAFFTTEFKHRLLASIDNIDDQTNGLLINSENFQALELLQEKYKRTIKLAYYDPPFNTSDGSFVYKNGYQQSSWCSMISNRISCTKSLLAQDGVMETAIDDFEQPYLCGILDDIFGFENRLGNLVIEIKPSGRTNDYFLATSHEYLLCYAKEYDNVSINFFPLSEEQRSIYNETTNEGIPTRWRDFMRTGGYSTPEERPNSYYPIFYNPETNEISVEEIDGYIKILPVDSTGKHRVWRKTIPSFIKHLEKGEIKVDKRGEIYKVRIIDKIKDGVRPKSVWIGSKYDASAHGTKLIKNIFGQTPFSFPKAIGTVQDSIYLVCDEGDTVIDAFAGSGTTGEAVIKLNRDAEESGIKYILCEVNDYFNSVTKPRVEKVIYSQDWRDGKPVNRIGISQCFKYIRLEQYEDTLNNLQLRQQGTLPSAEFGESYMLQYMLDVEARNSLLNLQWFENPFAVTLKTTRDNELVDSPVDMIETFNYLIGLNVETMSWHADGNICMVMGKTHGKNEESLIIWRNCKEIDNDKLNDFFKRRDFSALNKEFDVIYVNGDNTLPNLRRDEQNWKVVLIEEEFNKRMFEEN